MRFYYTTQHSRAPALTALLPDWVVTIVDRAQSLLRHNATALQPVASRQSPFPTLVLPALTHSASPGDRSLGMANKAQCVNSEDMLGRGAFQAPQQEHCQVGT